MFNLIWSLHKFGLYINRHEEQSHRGHINEQYIEYAKSQDSRLSLAWVRNLCLAISVGEPAHEGADLAAAVEMIENTGKPCVIRLSDTLQRHNYMAAGAGVREAWDMSRKAGDEWLARNIAVLNRLSHKPEIVRWDSVLKHPDFDGVHYSFIRLSETNAIVAEALARDVETFLAKRQFGSNEERAIYEKCSRAFLLEETAGPTIFEAIQLRRFLSRAITGNIASGQNAGCRRNAARA